jgi:hypothetical protein
MLREWAEPTTRRFKRELLAAFDAITLATSYCARAEWWVQNIQ